MTVGQSAFVYIPETTVIATTIGQKSNCRVTIDQNDVGYGIDRTISQTTLSIMTAGQKYFGLWCVVGGCYYWAKVKQPNDNLLKLYEVWHFMVPLQ